MASRNNIPLPNKRVRRGLTRLRLGVAALTLLSVSLPLAAQDQQAPQRLEDLIPDSAVENPEEWATDGVPDAEQTEEGVEPALDPTSPMAELPESTVVWPDEDMELPQLAPLEPEDDIQFAEDDGGPQPVLADATVETVNSELTLAFPAAEQTFPVRQAFVDRFEALSTIEELSADESSIAQLAARAREDEDLLNQLLEVYGYYDAQVIRTIIGGRPRDREADVSPAVRFDIIPGTRFRFGEVNLGQLDQTPDYSTLRAAFEINTGDPVSSDAIVREQADLGQALGETGYPFAEINPPELLVDYERTEADLTMVVLPNGKYVFAGVDSELPEFLSDKHLETIARFDAGDVYQRSLETDLRRAITQTGLVSSVTVTPREVTPPSGDKPGEVVLDVGLTKAPLRTISGGIGYGTEEGVRVEASWEHRNLFPSEGALKVRTIVGTQEQLAGVTLTKNNFRGRDKILTLDAYASTLDSDAYDAQTVALVGTYERKSTLLFQKAFGWGGGFEVLASRERPPAVGGVVQDRQTYYVGALPGFVLFDATDDLLDPQKGFRIGGRISPEISRTLGAQSFYLKSQIDASYYQKVTDKVVIAARTRAGTIQGTALENIAPSRRFYAGGGSSVRGYGYQQIGPLDSLDDPSGGRSVVEFSLEARVRTGLMDGAVAVVPFVDAGSVSSSTIPDFDSIKIGAGLGLRYYSGFGPIRVDVGVPLNPGANDSPVAVYVSLGQAF